MAIKFLHFLHNESKALWTFESINDKSDCYEATWKVTCKCGKVVYRKRAFMKPNKISKELLDLCIKTNSLQRYIDNGTYETFFGHTLESAIKQAKAYKGDNYHI